MINVALLAILLFGSQAEAKPVMMCMSMSPGQGKTRYGLQIRCADLVAKMRLPDISFHRFATGPSGSKLYPAPKSWTFYLISIEIGDLAGVLDLRDSWNKLNKEALKYSCGTFSRLR